MTSNQIEQKQNDNFESEIRIVAELNPFLETSKNFGISNENINQSNNNNDISNNFIDEDYQNEEKSKISSTENLVNGKQDFNNQYLTITQNNQNPLNTSQSQSQGFHYPQAIKKFQRAQIRTNVSIIKSYRFLYSMSNISPYQ